MMQLDFNQDWEFQKEGAPSCLVTLPHDAMRLEGRSPSIPGGLQSGYFPGGVYRYVKRFRFSEEDIGKRVELFFEGVYRNATVWLNGIELGSHRYGYGEFSIDLSPAVKGGENVVEVRVDNSLTPNCRWYSGSGIYRPVWLRILSKDAPSDVRIVTKSLAPVVIEASAEEGTTIEIYDGETLIARGMPGEFRLGEARLWSADDPYLYTAIARRGSEETRVSFGVRMLEWDSENGFRVNGVRTLLRGGCIHHDNGILGAVSLPDAEMRRVRILKECGFNALRISHNPASRALLDACDRLGMYVIDECFDGWYIPKDYHDYSRDFREGYEGELLAMARKDFNHPCVIMYSLGNEVTETASSEGIALCGKMRNILKSFDPTRPVTCGINVLLNVYVKRGLGVYRDRGHYEAKPLPEGKAYREKKSGSTFFNYWTTKLGKLMFFISKGKTAEKLVADVAPSLDVVGLNYASSRYDLDAKRYPRRLMVGTETMVGDIVYNWSRVRRYPQLFGDFVWAAWDYLGEACIGDWTYHSYPGLPLLSGQGVVDMTGYPKAQMAYLQIGWGLRKSPFLAVSPLNHSGEKPSKSAWQFTDAVASWNWQGHEGKKTMAEVYADAPMVALYLNGKLLKKKKTKRCRACFALRYTPGILCAVAYDESGKEIGRHQLESGGDQIFLRVSLDAPNLRANNEDLCFATFEFVDEKGELKPSIEEEISLRVSGDGAILAGMGSALCKTNENFVSNTYRTYRGRAIAAFRATGSPGAIEVTVSSPLVKDQTFIIEVKDEMAR